MSIKKPKGAESVRDQWTQQRVASAGRTSARDAAPRGSHFAKPASASMSDPSALHPVAAAPRMTLPSLSAPMPPVPPTPSGPAPVSAPTPASRAQRRITGVSGEFPKVPVKPKRSQAIPYSRYNKRYVVHPERVDLETVVESFSTGGLENAPAYAWRPFLAYGGACALVCVLWCLAVRLTSTAAPTAGEASLTIGLALLALIVAGGLVTGALTSALTLRAHDDLARLDVVASALGKTALAMFAAALVWVAAMAVVTFVQY